MTAMAALRTRPGRIPIRDASLYVDVVGRGYPLLLMHGGPGADHWTLLPFRQLADQFTLVSTITAATGVRRALPSRP
jgi:pimeloyl-ACP methyl ester carboxylesterase